MRLWSLAFFGGVISLYFFSALPPFIEVLSIALMLFTLYFFRDKRYFIGVAIYVLGFLWMLLHAHGQLQNTRFLSGLEGKKISIQGRVISLPEVREGNSRFEFKISRVYFEGNTLNVVRKVRLSWFNSGKELHVGDELLLEVRLRKSHSQLNMGSFDYEKWLFQQGVHAVGYVLPKGKNMLLASGNANFLQEIRHKLDKEIHLYLQSHNFAGMIAGLSVGSRHQITAEQWQVMQGTGTNHLMAISGLHIGLVSGFIFLGIYWLWRRSERLMLWIPTPLIASLGALCAAWLYSALAGFALPTQRAVIMIAVFLMAVLCRKHIPPWQAWCLSLLFLLVLDPLASLSDSFWLSFGAVAVIIYGVSGRLYPHGLWWKWGRTQWVVTLGLFPMTLLFFQQVSLVSFVANLLAIPWVGFIVLPLSLLGSLFLLFAPPLGELTLKVAEMTLGWLWPILSWLAALPHVRWYLYVPQFGLLLLAGFGALFLLMPRGMPGRWMGIFFLLPLLLWKPPIPQKDELWFTLLDVGQGLSAVVRTQNHTLVYDTGPRYHKDFDMGQTVLVPFLRASGIKEIDMLVISHGDNDHIGGASSLIKAIPIKKIISQACYEGQSWEWDGVKFEFLYPPSQPVQSRKNDNSCVLRISQGEHSILLPGDIEKQSERYLLQKPERLKSTILVVPHHGSRTSSTADFVKAVRPKYALFPFGYLNRYRFPHPLVEERYRQVESTLMNTSNSGSISFILKKNKALELPKQYRIEQGKYWNHHPMIE